MEQTATETDAPTETTPPALLPTMGEQCAACGAPLAPDQRYCIECGERRGQPRLPFMDGRSRPEAESAPPPRRARRPRGSTGLTLIAGIATLVIALGVGVLIGHSGNDHTVTAAGQKVQVVTVGGGAASTTAGATTQGTDTTATTSTAGSKAKNAKAASSSKAASAKKAATKAPSPTVTVGSKCNGGKGCKNGKFTGDFFGP